MDFFKAVFYLLIRTFFCRLLLLLLPSYYFKFLISKKGQTKQSMQLKTKTNIKFRNTGERQRRYLKVLLSVKNKSIISLTYF